MAGRVGRPAAHVRACTDGSSSGAMRDLDASLKCLLADADWLRLTLLFYDFLAMVVKTFATFHIWGIWRK
jgi:hypothetical protein